MANTITLRLEKHKQLEADCLMPTAQQQSRSCFILSISQNRVTMRQSNLLSSCQQPVVTTYTELTELSATDRLDHKVFSRVFLDYLLSRKPLIIAAKGK